MLLITFSFQREFAPPSFAGGFESEPSIVNIANTTLNVTLSPSYSGIAYYAIVDINAELFEAALIKSEDPIVGIYYKGNASVTLGFNNLEIELSSAGLTLGHAYQIQIVLFDGTNDWISPTQPPFYYGGLVGTPTLIETFDDGFLLQYQVNAPGRLYTKLFLSTDSPAELIYDSPHNLEKAEFSTSIAANQVVTVSLRNQTTVTLATDYKAYSIFQDAYGVIHEPWSIFDALKTSGNRLLSVSYDNGSLANLDDDKIILAFQNLITGVGGPSSFIVEFDNGSSTFQNADIAFDVHPYEFEDPYTFSGNKVFLTLRNWMPDDYSYGRINTPEKFDNGSFRVTVASGAGIIFPPMDSNTTYSVKEAPLNQTQIQQTDIRNIQMQSLSYTKNNTPADQSDDSLTVTFTGDLSVDMIPINSLLLDADNNSTGGFISPDVTFIKGTDYTVSSLTDSQKEIVFEPLGVEKLNLLSNATFRVQLGNDDWGIDPNPIDPSIHSLFVNVKASKARLSDIKFDGNSIGAIDENLFEYDAVLSYNESDQYHNSGSEIQLSRVVAIPINPMLAVKTDWDGDTYIHVIAPDGTDRGYIFRVKADPFSLNNLTMNDETISGFNPLKRAYTINYPTGDENLPYFELNFENPLITPQMVTTSDEGTLPGTYVYTISVAGAPINEPNTQFIITVIGLPITLSNLTFNGTQITGFSPNTTDYFLTQPTGVTNLPTLVPSFANTDILPGDVDISHTGNLPGEVVFTITTSKGTLTKVINITITSDPILLDDLIMNGTTIPNFDPNTASYTINQGTGNTTLPTFSLIFLNTDILEEHVSITHTGSLPGTAFYTLNTTKGTLTKIITVNVTSQPITLSDLTVNGTTIAGFSAEGESYSIVHPTGLLTLPTVTPTFANGDISALDFTITSTGSFPGTVVYTITATKGTQTKVVTVTAISLPISLSNLTVNGTQIEGFAPDKMLYNITQSTGQLTPPAFNTTFLNGDISSDDVNTAYSGSLPGTMVYIIEITKGVLSKPITINVTSSPLILTDLTMNGIRIDGFGSEISVYNISHVTGDTSLPIFIPNFSNSDISSEDISITHTGSLPGTAIYTIGVTKGSLSKLITVNVTSSPITISNLTVNGTQISGFSASKTTYDLTQGTGETTLPEFALTFANSDLDNSNVSISHKGSLPGTAIFSIVISKGTQTKTITINVTSLAITLSDLTVDGTQIVGFDPKKDQYQIVRATGDTLPANIVPVFTNTDILSSNINISLTGALPGTLVYTLQISKGTQNRTIDITVISNPILLKMLSVNGTSFPKVDPAQSNYAMTLVVGEMNLPTIAYTFENSDISETDVALTHVGDFPGTIVYTLNISKGALTRIFTISVISNSMVEKPERIKDDPEDSPVSSSENAAQAAAKEIDTINQTLGNLQNNTTADTTPEIVTSIRTIVGTVDAINNETALFGAMSQLNGTLNLINRSLVNPLVDENVVMINVANLTQKLEGKLILITNPEDLLTVLTQFIDVIKKIKLTSGIQTINMDQSIEDMLIKTTESFGRVSIEAPISQAEGILIQAQDLVKPIAIQQQFIGELNTLNSAYFGDSDTRVVKTKVIIVVDQPISDNNVAVTFNPDSLKSIKDNFIESLGLEVNGTTISIPGSEFRPSGNFRIEMTFVPSSNQNNTPPSVDFTVFENNLQRGTFAHPIELRFELASFGLEPVDGNYLAIYKMNEITKTWTVVGGIVDPESGNIFVNRNSLSQYTVMKSKKSFSDSNNSWAKVEIQTMLNKGIVEETNNFNPKALLTRAEFASWIAKAYGLVGTSTEMPFKDVPKSNKDYNAISAMYQLGLIGGKTKNMFDPNGNLTADEMAVILGKVVVMFDNKKVSSKSTSKYLSGLKSKDVASWAEGDTALLMELGMSKNKEFAQANGYVTKETVAAAFMTFYRS